MHCIHCGNENIAGSNFCITCGKPLRGEHIDLQNTSKKYFVQTILLFIFLVIIIVLSSALSDMTVLAHEILFNALLFLVFIVFLFFDPASLFRLLKIHFRPSVFFLLTAFAPFLAFLVIPLAEWFNKVMDLADAKYYVQYMATPNMMGYGLLFVSVLPGFIEELLFRGILFNYLLRFTRPKTVILITGLLFSFIHFSFVSMIWLLAIGIFLGYLRYRYRTIWYGIYFHCIYNASVFLLEMVI